jgi:hypothetical protein
MLDFLPPRESALARALARVVGPLLLKRVFKVAEVDIDAASVAVVQSTDGFPTVILPNHPTKADPAVVYQLSKQARRRFRFMAARETFGHRGLARVIGLLMQGLGVYSVIRGGADRRAIRTTTDTLVEASRRLVLFPEGLITSQNGTLMAFERGVVQSCFWALDALTRADDHRPLYVIPTAIRYHYPEPVWDQIDTALRRLERRLDRQSSAKASGTEERYPRLRRIGASILSVVEREYRVAGGDEVEMNVRITALRHAILAQMETALALGTDPEQPPAQRIALIRNAVDEEVFGSVGEVGEVGDAGDYARDVHSRRLATLQRFYSELRRMRNFVSIYAGYVSEDPSQERYLEVIRRFEVEVFGKVKTRVPTRATLRCGPPIDLADEYARYRASESRHAKRTVTAETTQMLEDCLRHMLDA